MTAWTSSGVAFFSGSVDYNKVRVTLCFLHGFGAEGEGDVEPLFGRWLHLVVFVILVQKVLPPHGEDILESEAAEGEFDVGGVPLDLEDHVVVVAGDCEAVVSTFEELGGLAFDLLVFWVDEHHFYKISKLFLLTRSVTVRSPLLPPSGARRPARPWCTGATPRSKPP